MSGPYAYAGAASHTGIAKEVAFGVPVLPSARIPFIENSLRFSPGLFFPFFATFLREQYVNPLVGSYKFTGALNTYLYPTNAIELLVAGIGQDTVTGSGPLYTHTITAGTVLPSLTIEKALGNYQSEQYAGCQVGSLSIASSVSGDPVRLNCEIAAQSAQILDPPSSVPLVIDEDPFVFREGTITVLGGAVGATIQNVELRIDNYTYTAYVYGQLNNPAIITPTSRTVRGSFDVSWLSLNDSTYGWWSKMANMASGTLSVTWAKADGTSVNFYCPNMVIHDLNDNIDPNNLVGQHLTFDGYYDILNDLPSITATIVNAVAEPY